MIVKFGKPFASRVGETLENLAGPAGQKQFCQLSTQHCRLSHRSAHLIAEELLPVGAGDDPKNSESRVLNPSMPGDGNLATTAQASEKGPFGRHSDICGPVV